MVDFYLRLACRQEKSAHENMDITSDFATFIYAYCQSDYVVGYLKHATLPEPACGLDSISLLHLTSFCWWYVWWQLFKEKSDSRSFSFTLVFIVNRDSLHSVPGTDISCHWAAAGGCVTDNKHSRCTRSDGTLFSFARLAQYSCQLPFCGTDWFTAKVWSGVEGCLQVSPIQKEVQSQIVDKLSGEFVKWSRKWWWLVKLTREHMTSTSLIMTSVVTKRSHKLGLADYCEIFIGVNRSITRLHDRRI